MGPQEHPPPLSALKPKALTHPYQIPTSCRGSDRFELLPSRCKASADRVLRVGVQGFTVSEVWVMGLGLTGLGNQNRAQKGRL